MKLIADAFSRGMDEWIVVGKTICEIIDEDTDFTSTERLLSACHFLTEPMIRTFECIGRGTLHPLMLAYAGPGIKRLRKFPVHIQEKYASKDAKIPVLVITYDERSKKVANVDTLNLHVGDLSEAQAKQVFDTDHIRTSEEQRSWIEGEAMKRIPATALVNESYRIVGNKFIAMESFQISLKDLQKQIDNSRKRK